MMCSLFSLQECYETIRPFYFANICDSTIGSCTPSRDLIGTEPRDLRVISWIWGDFCHAPDTSWTGLLGQYRVQWIVFCLLMAIQ